MKLYIKIGLHLKVLDEFMTLDWVGGWELITPEARNQQRASASAAPLGVGAQIGTAIGRRRHLHRAMGVPPSPGAILPRQRATA